MSREIKFRAWNVEQKQMAKVSSLHSSMNIHVSYKKGEEKKGYFFGGNWVGADWNKDNSILMQFTGLKDKNGVNIYEGDVLQSRDELMIISNLDKYLHYDYYSFIFAVMYSESHSGLNGQTRNEIEIIGNIHENKY